MENTWTFEVTDDSGLMSLIDPDAYKSFLGEDHSFEELRAHCLAEMSAQHMLLWGTGTESTWRVEVRIGGSAPQGFREITGCISVSASRLAIVNHEDLSMAAMYPDEQLPQAHAEHLIEIPAGAYECRIVQLEDPANREEDEDKTDFVILLNEASSSAMERDTLVRLMPAYYKGQFDNQLHARS